MRFFLDTEFIEGKKSPKGLLGKICRWIDKNIYSFLPVTIQLVSIGIVSEGGREYYAVSKEFNPDDADAWVKANVLTKLPRKSLSIHATPEANRESLYWKSLEDIKTDIIRFLGGMLTEGKFGEVFYTIPVKHEFYGYYADYDWVVFCWLFGRMIDLPQGMPMYCRDLKQMLDEKPVSTIENVVVTTFPSFSSWKEHPDFPKQDDEHNALDDANWNRRLYQFLKSH